MSTSVKVVAIFAVRSGQIEELKALLVGMAPHCRAEPGNLHWDIWQDRSDPSRFVLDEMYKDETAVAAHHDTPHYKNYASRINDLADRTVILLKAA